MADMIEPIAKIVYDAMRYERSDTTPAWVEVGNSLAQVEARRAAQAIAALPAQGWLVKPLVFSEFSEGGCMGRPYPFQYFITKAHNGRFFCHHDDTWHDTLTAAQAHAQADYQRAALEPAEAGGVEAVDQSFFELIVDGMAEADRAMRKFPQPNYVISKVAEEAGEVVKAAIHCAENRETAENVRGEMRQLIAMLYRLWVEGDQVHGLAALAALRGGAQKS